MAGAPALEELLAEALDHPVEGWDFAWLVNEERLQQDAFPWDYTELVVRRARRSPDLLDLGTGGGERLASFPVRPRHTLATESYAPNVSVAGRRLAPLGIQVVRTSAADDNPLQGAKTSKGSLPFRDGVFHLVIDRNEAFVAREVARVLAPRGIFLTEQSGSAEIPDLYRLLDLPLPPRSTPSWDLHVAERQVARAGLEVLESGEADFEMRFRDVGALVWYLRAVPWTVPDFSVDRCRKRLEDLHTRVLRNGPIRIPRYAFWFEAEKK